REAAGPDLASGHSPPVSGTGRPDAPGVESSARRLRPPAVLALLVALLAALAVPARATFPFPPGPGSDPYDYTRLHVNNGACTPLAPGQSRPPGSDLPSNFDCRTAWKLTDYAAHRKSTRL